MEESSSQTFQVDLSNCAKEPIHIPGFIQPYGHLLEFDQDLTILSCNQKLMEMYEIPEYELGRRHLKDVSSDFQDFEFLFFKNQSHIITLQGEKYEARDVSTNINILLEITPLSKSIKDYEYAKLNQSIEKILQSKDEKDWAFIVADSVKDLLGYDRVMIYKFDQNFNGHVFEEIKSDHIKDSFKGLHYPESDIPPQARELYKRKLSRVIFNVNYSPDPIIPRSSTVDLSDCNIRSVSPIHIEYLQNMGVSATCVLSIMIDDNLWGLVACHHYAGEFVLNRAQQIRAENLTLIASQTLKYIVDNQSRSIKENAMLKASNIFNSSFDESIDEFFEKTAQTIFDGLPLCKGLVLKTKDRFYSFGKTLEEKTIESIVGQITKDNISYFSSSNIIDDFAKLNLTDIEKQKIRGLLFYPLLDSGNIEESKQNYLIFFREEYLQNVNWAGDPSKKAFYNEELKRLSPRGSFELYREEIKDKSKEWTMNDIQVGNILRGAVRDFLTAHYQSRLSTVKELYLQSQRVIDLGKISSKASHDFNNILQGIKMSLKLIEKVPNEKLEENINRFVKRGEDLVKSMMNYVRFNKKEYKQFSVPDLTDDIAILMNTIIPKNIKFKVKIGELKHLVVNGAKEEVFQSLINIMKNSIDAINMRENFNGGVIEFEVLEVENYVQFIVKDNGCGVSQGNLSKIFNPFYTTKEEGVGTGLGLSVINEIIKNHNGTFDFQSEENQGSTMIISLPVQRSLDNKKNEIDIIDAANIKNKNLTIKELSVAFIEDDIALNSISVEVFGTHFKKMYSFFSADEFLNSEKFTNEDYDLIISDMRMPGMTGLELLEHLRKENNHTPFILLSGEMFLDSMITDSTLMENLKILNKPIDDELLISSIKELLQN